MKFQIPPKIIFSTLFIFFAIAGFSQNNNIELLENYKDISPDITAFLKKGRIATFKKDLANELQLKKPATFNLTFQFENKEWEIILEKSELLSKGFFITTSTNPNDKFSNSQAALHYKGTVKGKPHSFAAVSILSDRLVAVISDDETGNINIGAINSTNAKAASAHIIYRDTDLLLKNEFICASEDSLNTFTYPIPVYSPLSIASTTINPEPVDIYFEADYTTYINNSSDVSTVVNYVTALFNVVNTLYENDSINTKISAIKVWNTVDPYNVLSTTSAVLNAFSANMSIGFPGDLAHFLSQRGLGGGIAFLNVLCSGNSSKTAVSGNLSNSFNPFPIYSWSAMVITHELGHNLGSPHTQSCSWPGGAIDNCYATEGGCSQGPAPVSGGTIMSYCHLTGYGINFANGFGPLPGQRIRSLVRDNSCINPGVYFETTYQNVSEESADVENGCLDYKIITTKLKIPYEPSQPVAISLMPSGSDGLIIGTNKDVEITPMNFTLDGSNLSQAISFKVYNDAIIENLEILTLNFDINANGGNAVKRNYYTTDIINISSDDYRPDSTPNQRLYFESFDAVSGGLGNWTQLVNYGDLSPNRWIVGNSGDPDFSTKAAYISNNGTALAYSGAVLNDSSMVRLVSPLINANAFSNLQLTYSYKCFGEGLFVNGGSGSGLTGLDYGKVFYSINNGSTWVLLKDNIFNRSGKIIENITFPADGNNSSGLRIAFEWLNNSTIVKNPPFIIDSIVINGAAASPIQTTADAANVDEEYLGPFQTVHFFNPITKNIIATIENTSAFDFGCTRMELVRTGNDATQAWGVSADQKISEKAFKVTSQNSNTSAPYTLKLYYTTDEINGWLGSTGNVLGDVKIVKTTGDITLPSPSTPPIFSSINSRYDYGVMPHFIFAGTFAGFSSFAIMKSYVVPECPGNNITYGAGVTGSSYQWQVNTGSGYNNISNNAIYAGASADSLKLNSPPTFFYGNTYRCIINAALGSVYSPEFTLKFGVTWIGSVSKSWENPLNWGCGIMPDDNTDVIINGTAVFTPELSANATIRSLKLISSANLLIKTGAILSIRKQ